jgi:hypothetical protein
MLRLLLGVLTLNVVASESLSVDYWRSLNLSKSKHLRGVPLRDDWVAKHGSELLVNVVAPTPAPKSKSIPPGPPEDFTLLRHKAERVPEPVNRNYK